VLDLRLQSAETKTGYLPIHNNKGETLMYKFAKTKTLCLSLWFLVTPTWANVGLILLFDGAPSDVELIRNDKPEEVFPEKPLEVGDKIRVTRDIPPLRLILLLNGEQVILTYEKTHPEPYQVQASEQLPSEWANAVKSMASLFRDIQKSPDLIPIHLPKGGSENHKPLTMPLLTGDSVKLLADKTTLSLGWQGGQPPYRVQVTLKESPQKRNEAQSETTSVTLANFQAIPGHYLVEVQDNAKQSSKGEFEVVTDSAISAILKDAQALQELSPESRQVLLASRLAQQPEWRLEAYQQVADIAKKFYPAWLVKVGLEAGIEAGK
jgi:hypothetical protein